MHSDIDSQSSTQEEIHKPHQRRLEGATKSLGLDRRIYASDKKKGLLVDSRGNTESRMQQIYRDKCGGLETQEGNLSTKGYNKHSYCAISAYISIIYSVHIGIAIARYRC